jgi:ComF family protein
MLIDLLTNIIFPPVCVACRKRIPRGAVCDTCLASVALHDALMCGACHATSVDPGEVLDGRSHCHPDFPFLLGGATDYENPVVAALAHNLKFRFIRGAAESLGDLLYNYATRTGIDFSDFTTVPIPLSRRRLRERGFNQAELIARRFAQNNSSMIDTSLLVRTKYAKPQSETGSPAERRENIRGVFVVPNPDMVRGRNILLIDDVSTSGATFLEAATTLKSAGAGKIIALAVAKT